MLCQLAAPPVGCGPLMLVALVPVLTGLRHETGARTWGTCGLIVGLLWHAGLPRGLASWGILLPLAGWLTPSVLVAAAFLSCCWLRNALKHDGLACAFPLAFWGATVTGELVLGVPVSAAACLMLGPDPLVRAVTGLARVVGVFGIELLLAGTTALAAEALAPGHHRRRWVAAAGCLGIWSVAWLTSALAPAPRPHGTLTVHAVLPQVSSAEYRDARWSPKARRQLEQRVDRLLARAGARVPGGLIVLPEGGNGLANERLLRRRSVLGGIIGEGNSEALIAGEDLTPGGLRFNTVSLMTHAGQFRARARKQHPVPLAEGRVASGEVRVLHARAAQVAVPICFDALFTGYLLTAVSQGAEVVIAVSDDAGFGPGGLARWHAAHAALRAAAAGRALVFVANGGPLLATSIDGTARHDAVPRTPGVHTLHVPKATGLTLSVAAPWLHAVIALGLLLVGLRRRRRRARAPSRPIPAWAPAMALVLTAGLAPSSELVASAAATGLSVRQLLRDLRQRRDPGSQGSSFPAFHQTLPGTCGFAALAFLLHQLGDSVYEHELIPPRGPRDSHHLGELAEAARARGFAAKAVATGLPGLPRALGEPPVIAHLRHGHFVTVVGQEDNRLVAFDPGVGQLVHYRLDAFARAWTGRILRVTTRDL